MFTKNNREGKEEGNRGGEMVLISPVVLQKHYGKDAYVGEALCAPPPFHLIAGNGTGDDEESTLQQIYREISERGKQLFQTSANTIKTIAWQSVANTDTVPVFLITLKKAIQSMQSATGTALRKAVALLVAAAARFWEYITTFITGTKKTLEIARDEVLACERLLERFGDTAVRVVRWIASGVSGLVSAMLGVLHTAAANIGDVAGQFASFLYRQGYQGATEFMLMTYFTYQEMIERKPDTDYIVKTGLEISKFCDTLRNFISDAAFKVMEFMGITGGLSRILNWISSFAKGFYFSVFDILWGIFRRVVPLMATVLSHVSLSCTSVFEKAKDIFTFEELVEVGQMARSDPDLPDDARERISFATEKLQDFLNVPIKSARPWLAANVIKDIYYHQDPDSNIIRQIIEDRTGQDASVFLEQLKDRYTLLESEIWIAYANAPPAHVQTALVKQKEFIGGFFTDLFGCGKGKKKRDDECRLVDDDSEKQLRNEDPTLNLVLDSRNLKLLQQKLTEINEKLNIAREKQKEAEDLVEPDLAILKQENRLVQLNAIDHILRIARPGDTENAGGALRKLENWNEARLKAYEVDPALLNEIATLEQKKRLLEGGLMKLEAEVERSTKKYVAIILCCSAVFGIVWYSNTILGAFTGQWNAVRDAASNIGLDSIFNLWYNIYKKENPLSSLTSTADVRTLHNIGSEAITRFASTPLTPSNFEAILSPIETAAGGILQTRRASSSLSDLASKFTTAIEIARKSGLNVAGQVDVMGQLVTIKDLGHTFLTESNRALSTVLYPVSKTAAADIARRSLAYIPFLSTLQRYFSLPSFDDLTPVALLKVAETPLPEAWLIALEKLFEAGIHVVTTYTAMIIVIIGGVAHTASILINTNTPVIETVSWATARIISSVFVLSGPMFKAIAIASQAQQSQMFGAASAIFALAVIFFPGAAVLSRILSLLRRIRGRAATRPSPQETINGDKKTKNRPNLGEVARGELGKLYVENALNARNRIEAGKPSAPRKKPVLKILCRICSEPATIMCGHCTGRVYCGNQCAAIDWMGNDMHTGIL